MTEFQTSDFVITARFDDFDEHHLQLWQGDKILVTVCEPAGPGDRGEFCVWIGDGLDPETDEEATPLIRFYTKHTLDVNETWRKAVRAAYQHASNFMS